MPRPVSLVFCLLAASSAIADGPKDNVPADVRRIPKLGIEVSEADRKGLEESLAALDGALQELRRSENAADRESLPDIEVFHRAVRTALDHQEFFEPKEIDKARKVLDAGIARRVERREGRHDSTRQTGLVVRGYRSKIDQTVQPYGLVIPATYRPDGEKKYRLDVWFHGRGETLSEVNFIHDRMTNVGQFAPADTFVLHPYGRYCNANKFAGETDVLEAIEDVKRKYRIDEDRVSVRGFSMGGAACWQFAVHYPDRWFAANPGAGFAETPRFLDVFQKEKLEPTWYEQKLWRLYDCDLYALNLAQCPTVAYSGEIDSQKQAADVMAEALAKHGIPLTHVIGPQTAHKYHPDAAAEVERRMASLAEVGREPFPRHVRFETYTLKYNRASWVTVDALGEHWERVHVDAEVDGDRVYISTDNVTALTLAFPPGRSPFEATKPVSVTIDGAAVEAPAPSSDRSWSVSLVRDGDGWKAGAPPAGLRKRHDLQGPIDDAFMDSFVFVRPTGTGRNPAFDEWCRGELDRAIEHWRRHFRGDARVVDDTAVTDELVASANLILWGDPESNAVLRRVAADLPIGWNAEAIRVGDRSFPAERHALILIHPNPLNPNRYVVLNSSFTFRDYAYLNNARQVPMLPDWAVIDLTTKPDTRYPSKVAAADFFGEDWSLRPPR